MKEFVEVMNLIRDKFDVAPITEIAANMMLLKVNGLDNNSLAKYIVENIDGLKVTVKGIEGYKLGNNGWIKIEKSGNKESVLEITKCGS